MRFVPGSAILPQFLSTALSAMLEDRFGDAPDLRAIGGRALREMTRLGASPYSMWRDIAHTNEAAIAEALVVHGTAAHAYARKPQDT